MEKNSLSLLKVILSRARSKRLLTHKLFPEAILIVPDSEVEAYRPYGLKIVAVPDSIRGCRRVSNWVLRKFSEKIVVFFDDDIYRCVSLTGLRQRHMMRSELQGVVESAAICAMDAGASLFGWNQAWDVRKYNPTDPFRLNTWVGGAVGVIGRKFFWDDRLTLKSDLDFCLQHLLKERILWCDSRFSFVQLRETNIGGNAPFRTAQLVEAEKKYLKEKWRSSISFGFFKGTGKSSISVPRRIGLDLF